MAEVSSSACAEFGRSRMPVSGSTSVAAQRTMRLTTFSRAARSDRDLRVEQIELVPGRPACDVEIAAEAERMDRSAGGVLQRRDRGEVDDRDHLPRHVGKAVARRRAAPSAGRAVRRRRTPRRTARSRRGLPACAGRRARPRGFPSGWSACGSSRRRRCAARPAGRSASASGSAAWADSRAPPGRSRTARSRSHTSGRTARSDGPPARLRQRLGRQPLHRIAVDGLDFRALAGHPDLINGPAVPLKALTKIKAVPLFGAVGCFLHLAPADAHSRSVSPGATVWARGSD